MSDWDPSGFRKNARPVSNSSTTDIAPELRGQVFTTYPIPQNVRIPPPIHRDRLVELRFPRDPIQHAIRLGDDSNGNARWTWWGAMQANSESRYRQQVHPAARDWRQLRDEEAQAYRQQLAQTQQTAPQENDQDPSNQESTLTNLPEQDSIASALPATIDATSPPATAPPNSTTTMQSAATRQATRPVHDGSPQAPDPPLTPPRAAANADPVESTPLTSSVDVYKIIRRCKPCHLKKKGCDGEWPCGRCVDLGNGKDECEAYYRRKDLEALEREGLTSPPKRSLDQAGMTPPPKKRQRLDSNPPPSLTDMPSTPSALTTTSNGFANSRRTHGHSSTAGYAPSTSLAGPGNLPAFSDDGRRINYMDSMAAPRDYDTRQSAAAAATQGGRPSRPQQGAFPRDSDTANTEADDSEDENGVEEEEQL